MSFSRSGGIVRGSRAASRGAGRGSRVPPAALWGEDNFAQGCLRKPLDFVEWEFGGKSA